MKSKKMLYIVSALFVLVFCMLMISACSDGGNGDTEIISCEIKDGKVKLTASLDDSYAKEHSKDTVYLLALSELDPSGSLAHAEQVAESRAKSNLTFNFSLTSTSGASRVASAFVIAEKNGESYSALTGYFYIQDPHKLAEKETSGNEAAGIKGLASEDVYGNLLLGAEHILLEAEMNKLILSDYAEGAVKFNLDGVSYYYDADEVERLDKLIADADNASMRIFLRTVLRTEESNNDEDISFLYCKSAKDSYGYLPNLSDARAVRYVKAFYAFLASRYPVADFVIGEKVNSYGSYCNAGKLTSDEFEIMYSFWARLAHQMLKSINYNAVIYIPVDNTWRTDVTDGKIGAKVFLSRFADTASKGGNYAYAVALNLCNGDDRAALISGSGHDFSKLGATNLSDMTNFLDNAEMKYKGEKRELIIDGLSLPTSVREKDRASYYTYTYYTASEIGVSAFFYSGQILTKDQKRSELYYSMLMCGSDLNSQLNEYTERLPDVNIPDFKDHITSHLTYVQTAKTEINDSVLKDQGNILLDINSFTAYGGAYNIQGVIDGDGARSLRIDADTSGSTSAVCMTEPSNGRMVNSRYIGLKLSSDKPLNIALIISVGDRSYIGETAIESGEGIYFFDIYELSGNADRSKDAVLSICILPDGDGDASVEIKEISLIGSSSGKTETVIIIAAVGVVALAFIALIILLVIKRKRKAVRHASHDAD